MPPAQTNVAVLADQYTTLVQEAHARILRHRGRDSTASVRKELVGTGDWTPQAADALIDLARRYGVFMLRNALALAVALDIEDGSLGY